MIHDTQPRETVDSSYGLTGSMLSEALPYIQRFAGKIVVVKYGGNALAGSSDVDAASTFARDIALMHAVGIKPVVVHGGGPQISALMERLGKKPEFRDGLRVTDQETIEIASMVLLGTVNPQLVSAINVHGARAVGVSGQDAGLLQVTQRDPGLGFVGDIHSVDPTVLLSAIHDNTVPVVATIGSDASGQAYNVNADTAAAAIAVALGAEKLIYLTDIEGLRAVKDDPSSLVRKATASQIAAMLKTGSIDGGMIPKMESCVSALQQTVRDCHILDGRIAHVLLIELFTIAGVGTMISKDSGITLQTKVRN
ncbi:MAG: acetylglutamate kinase [Acidimicrobiia bacterium BACL6 MAG-121220-bin61]|jgi:acetylglutamate kinase|nr:MAG: acetylglutamate kinase [Acidimicrobiia bacterium BACL6 MAG-120910-bin40]KRO57549.1 MAG: acetylglutamate kinase [Acidimicrobiia bacterium BACL6 MAG-120322-bin79]KRO63985.1 MAG: acetylglutamate kinase [Acidimicrobiia bacterium BACL6 MAG-121220-bin61]